MNRYNSMISSGDIKFIKSEKIKETLTRLHNLNYSNLKTSVEYEKSLKQELINILTENHSEILFAADSYKTSIEIYSSLLHKSIQSDQELKSNLLIHMKYFKSRVSLLKLYMYTLDELKSEVENSLD